MQTEDKLRSEQIWIISKGRYKELDLSRIREEAKSQTVMEYRISDLARYLLNPKPIQVDKKLVGCEAHYHQPTHKLKTKISPIFPSGLQGWLQDKPIPPDIFFSDFGENHPAMKDEQLESHFNKITEVLKPYDSMLEKLSNIDPRNIADIIGTCRDKGGNLSYLNIPGTIDAKIDYVKDYLLKDVGVTLEKANISEGLFEMNGFDFESFDPKNSYRLIKFMLDGKSKACVLNCDTKIEYWVDDIKLIQYMQLFDQIIKTNPRMNESLRLCSEGKAEPLKLLFNKQLEIDYSETQLPVLYRGMFDRYHIDSRKKVVVTRALSHSQMGVSFNCVPQTGSSEDKSFTTLSVMHNIGALEPIKSDLPQVYSEVDKRASVTEGGKYYLLDSFRGYKNDE